MKTKIIVDLYDSFSRTRLNGKMIISGADILSNDVHVELPNGKAWRIDGDELIEAIKRCQRSQPYEK